MSGGERARLFQSVFGSAPLRARLLFFAGVFCCFAPVGLLSGIQGLGRAPWSDVAIQTAFSGGLAVGWAVCAIHFRRWLPLMVVMHLTLSAAMRHWVPDTTAPVSLTAAEAIVVRHRLSALVLLTVSTIAMAYFAFLMFILGEGRRAVLVYTEIRLAREIHATLVPPVSGESSAISWRGASKPSGEVGGDLVDVIETDRGWIGCIADVTGHGVAAGVLMGMFKATLHASLPDAADLGDLVTRVNRALTPLTQSNMFVTCACVGTRPGAREIEYVLAGHPSFLRVSKADGSVSWTGNQQLAVGLLPEVVFTSGTLPVAPGDVLMVVTDGLLEIFDRQEREFGPAGLAAAVQPLAQGGSLAEIESAIFQTAERFGAQTDDQTLLLIRIR